MTAPAGFDMAAAAEAMRDYHERVRIFELFNGEIQRSVPVSSPREPRITQPPKPPVWECPECDYTFGLYPPGLNITYVDHDCGAAFRLPREADTA
ncbi:hypothetical protein [Mycobacterium malmoense]|uniref:hypothetical protein n=1 Tax=Mycobacterium malmoense TaxID=1780 RepID=UPI0008F8BC23|nr:hypothetical protein [Mycobacterium malmoense]OIN80196.1 hypothetical protein BMG05_13185 [Mycobacterium malmoense]